MQFEDFPSRWTVIHKNKVTFRKDANFESVWQYEREKMIVLPLTNRISVENRLIRLVWSGSKWISRDWFVFGFSADEFILQPSIVFSTAKHCIRRKTSKKTNNPSWFISIFLLISIKFHCLLAGDYKDTFPMRNLTSIVYFNFISPFFRWDFKKAQKMTQHYDTLPMMTVIKLISQQYIRFELTLKKFDEFLKLSLE